MPEGRLYCLLPFLPSIPVVLLLVAASVSDATLMFSPSLVLPISPVTDTLPQVVLPNSQLILSVPPLPSGKEPSSAFITSPVLDEEVPIDKPNVLPAPPDDLPEDTFTSPVASTPSEPTSTISVLNLRLLPSSPDSIELISTGFNGQSWLTFLLVLNCCRWLLLFLCVLVVVVGGGLVAAFAEGCVSGGGHVVKHVGSEGFVVADGTAGLVTGGLVLGRAVGVLNCCTIFSSSLDR